jgi:antitoxin component YwqK of YwqJK toxin-antitoxin module
MLRSFFLLIMLSVFALGEAKCGTTDTTIIYLKNSQRGYYKVSTLDSADFFRMILPPDSGNSKYNVREYYKNGKIKLAGKSDPLGKKFKIGLISFSGDCIRYFPTGKRESITSYNKGEKEGFEYIFYPSGKAYFTLKHTLSDRYHNDEVLYWECYDTAGNMVCSNGNGNWVTYDREYQNVLIEGGVKNGYREGEWHGRVLNADSITYVYKYNKGVVTSSIGYDKKGNAYPFILINVAADYRDGFRAFIDELNGHLKVPKEPDGKKIILDNLKIAFTVNKDSTTSDLELLGSANPDLNHALVEALRRCHDWMPTRFYGIPYKTRVTLPLKYVVKAKGSWESFNIPFDEQVIGN